MPGAAMPILLTTTWRFRVICIISHGDQKVKHHMTTHTIYACMYM